MADSTTRCHELDGLRGIAVLLVVISHYYVLVDIAGAWRLNYALKHLLAYSGTGVDLFFVLSGFLVGGILIDRRHTPNVLPVFFTRRACRILPLYLLLLLSFVAAACFLPVAASHTHLLFGSSVPLWSYLLFSQNIVGPLCATVGPWWLAVTWSLAVEVHFYLLAPFVVRPISSRWWWGIAGAIVAASPFARWFVLEQLHLPHAASYATLMRIDGLLLGAMLAGYWRQPRRGPAIQQYRSILPKLVWGGIGFGMLLPFTALGANESFKIWALPSLASLLWTLVILQTVSTAGDGWINRGLRHPLLTGMGAVSYFVYLFHLPAQYAVHELLYQRFPLHLSLREIGATVLAFGLVVGLGAVSFISLERFMIRVGQRMRYERV